MFPYFDVLLEKLKLNDKITQEAFGNHVHWGYWNNPDVKETGSLDFKNAGESMIKQVLKNAQIRSNSVILDVGCGLGGTIKILNEKYSNCKLIGLNIDVKQIFIAEKAITTKNRNKINFVQADACSLPFNDATIDTILCVESIFHFDNRRQFFHECQRVLKSGGILVISDFVPIKIASFFLDFLELTFKLVNKVYGIVHLDISIQKYKKLAKDTGFSVETITDITANTFPTYKFLKKNLHLIKEEKEFNRATRYIEVASKIGIVKYLILSFRKK